MQVQYVQLTGTTPKIVELNNNNDVFNVSVEMPAGGGTLEVSVIQPADSVAPNSYTAAASTLAPIWHPAPVAVDGYITLNRPVSALRITPTAGGIAAILQQGI